MLAAAVSVVERDVDYAVLCVRTRTGWRLPGATAELPPAQIQSESLLQQTGLDTKSAELILQLNDIFAYKVVGWGELHRSCAWLSKEQFLGQLTTNKETYEKVLDALPKPKLFAIAITKQQSNGWSAPEMHHLHAFDAQNALVKFKASNKGHYKVLAHGQVIGYHVHDEHGERLSA